MAQEKDDFDCCKKKRHLGTRLSSKKYEHAQSPTILVELCEDGFRYNKTLWERILGRRCIRRM